MACARNRANRPWMNSSTCRTAHTWKKRDTRLLIGRIAFLTPGKSDTRHLIGLHRFVNENLLCGFSVCKSQYVYNKRLFSLGLAEKKNNVQYLFFFFYKERLICDFTFKHFGREPAWQTASRFWCFLISWTRSFSSRQEGKTRLKKLAPQSAIINISETTKGGIK